MSISVYKNIKNLLGLCPTLYYILLETLFFYRTAQCQKVQISYMRYNIRLCKVNFFTVLIYSTNDFGTIPTSRPSQSNLLPCYSLLFSFLCKNLKSCNSNSNKNNTYDLWNRQFFMKQKYPKQRRSKDSHSSPHGIGSAQRQLSKCNC